MRKKNKGIVLSDLESTLVLCTTILRQDNVTEKQEELLQEIAARLQEIKETLSDEKRTGGKSSIPVIVTDISVTIAKIAQLILDFFEMF